ncbi:MAG TPA: hypothetical protein PLB31_09015 [Fimbriimonadaceae bacterium]|nr:hypothetical protein [Armatimonadota bacterium]HCM73119.1 hypothetical protein [Armatimonadota bacterium]HRD32529.1 hypothetical protein [Fimbriimonadaceae bacterium]HRI74592.1 hypothetical protein [Fimbriimonadaceae bacterium]
MIRSYQPADEPAVRRICIETGLKGQLDELFCDKEAFASLWLNPYLHVPNPVAWVAERDDAVVGYLVGLLKDPSVWDSLRTLFPTLFRVRFRAITGQYSHHPPSRRFAHWLIFRLLREAPKSPKHLPTFHFNLTADARDSRLGDELMGAFFSAARAAGHQEFSIQIFVRPGKRDLKFYDRLGCRLLDVKETTVLKEPACFATLVRAIPEQLEWQRVRGRLSLRTRLVLPPGNENRTMTPQVWAPDEVTYASVPPSPLPGEVVIFAPSPEIPLFLVARVHQQIQSLNPPQSTGTGTLDTGAVRVTYAWDSSTGT